MWSLRTHLARAAGKACFVHSHHHQPRIKEKSNLSTSFCPIKTNLERWKTTKTISHSIELPKSRLVCHFYFDCEIFHISVMDWVIFREILLWLFLLLCFNSFRRFFLFTTCFCFVLFCGELRSNVRQFTVLWCRRRGSGGYLRQDKKRKFTSTSVVTAPSQQRKLSLVFALRITLYTAQSFSTGKKQHSLLTRDC